MGNARLVVKLMRTQYANQTGCSHNGVTRQQSGFTPMHCAAFGGHRDCLQVMLSWADGDPNAADPADGRTPLYLAAWRGNVECVEILLHHGGNPTLPDASGETALSFATEECRAVIKQHLYYGELWTARSTCAWCFGVLFISSDVTSVEKTSVANLSYRCLIALHGEDSYIDTYNSEGIE